MISGVTTLFTYNAFVLLVFILGWSFFAFRKKNYSLLEIGWPLSLVLVVWTSFLLFGAQSIYRRLLVLTVTIWGLRLAFHLYTLYWNKPESRRYVRLREDWEGKLSGLKAVLILVVGPLLAYYVVSMILSIGFLDSQESLHWWQYIGLTLWGLGMLFEIGSEVQLKKFRSKPENQGSMLTKGLWRISRHPHYFGTAIVWWGIYLISIVDWNNLLSILSPIMMTLFAIYLASRSSSEKEYQTREELHDYTRKTSQFLPFSAQIGRGLSSIVKVLGSGLSKMTKASAGAVSSAAKKAKDSRKKEDTLLEETPHTLTESETVTDSPTDPSTVDETTDQNWFKEDIPTENLASVTQTDSIPVDEMDSVQEVSQTEANDFNNSTDSDDFSDEELLTPSYEFEEDTIATEDEMRRGDERNSVQEVSQTEANDFNTFNDNNEFSDEKPLTPSYEREEDTIATEDDSLFEAILADEDFYEEESLKSAKEEVSEEIVAEMLEENDDSEEANNLQNKSLN